MKEEQQCGTLPRFQCHWLVRMTTLCPAIVRCIYKENHFDNAVALFYVYYMNNQHTYYVDLKSVFVCVLGCCSSTGTWKCDFFLNW